VDFWWGAGSGLEQKFQFGRCPPCHLEVERQWILIILSHLWILIMHLYAKLKQNPIIRGGAIND